MYHQKQSTANFISHRISMGSSDIPSVTTQSLKALIIPDEQKKSIQGQSENWNDSPIKEEDGEEKEKLLAEYKILKK